MPNPASPLDHTHPQDEDAMPYLPVFLDVRGRKILLIGGSEPAAAKARLLLRSGARVVLCADTLHPAMAALVHGGRIDWAAKDFHDDLLEGAVLAFDAADDEALTRKLREAAAARHVPVNVVDKPAACDFIVPAVLDRSPVMVAVSTGGVAPALARLIRQRLERALPARLGHLARATQACRSLVRERLTVVRDRQRFWDSVLAGPRADAIMALPEPEAIAAIRRELARFIAAREGEEGSVTLVGAGPGDPGLLTLAAARAIESADIILHDALVPDAVLALARRETELVPLGKRCGQASASQESINRTMVACAERGLRVVRLKGGDPFVFGRGGEEAACLRARGIAVRVIPGVTAALGIAAELGLPLTHRGVARSLCLVTASCRTDGETSGIDWRSMADPSTTLAVYMGRRHAAAMVGSLIDAGMPAHTPAVAVENGTQPQSRHCFTRLADLPAALARMAAVGPVLVVIGDAVAQAPGWAAVAAKQVDPSLEVRAGMRATA